MTVADYKTITTLLTDDVIADLHAGDLVREYYEDTFGSTAW